jgi:hypothetical protein
MKLESVIERRDATFEDLRQVVEMSTSLVERFKSIQERALARADETGPWADRAVLARAADMHPSQLYRVLERQGRPRNRRKAG